MAKKEAQQNVTASSSPDGDSTDLDTPKPFDMSSLKSFYVEPGSKKMTTSPVDIEGLKKHQSIRSIAERVAENADKAERNGMLEEAIDFYPNENRQQVNIGKQFNFHRAKAGLKTYHEDKPELAGALLLGAYSQNTNENNRAALVSRSAQTGIVQQHLSTGHIERAIASGAHPLEVLGRNKLRDFTGSALHPNTWEGEHNGEKLGLGYTIDRHQNDMGLGVKFGNSNRGLSSGDSGERRYRAFQAGHELAHEMYDPNKTLSRPAFQALSWGGWRGSFT